MFQRKTLFSLIFIVCIAYTGLGQPIQDDTRRYSRQDGVDADPLTGEEFITVQIAWQQKDDQYGLIQPEYVNLDPHAIYIWAHHISYDDSHSTQPTKILCLSSHILLEPGSHRIQKVIPSALKKLFYEYLTENEPALQNQNTPIDLDRWVQDMGYADMVKHLTAFYNRLILKAQAIHQAYPEDLKTRLRLIFNEQIQKLVATSLYAKNPDRRFWLWVFLNQFRIREFSFQRPQPIKPSIQPCVTMFPSEVDPITKLELIHLKVTNAPHHMNSLSGLYRIACKLSNEGEWKNGLAFINPAFTFGPGEWMMTHLIPDLFSHQQYIERLIQNNRQALPINQLFFVGQPEYQNIWATTIGFLNEIFRPANEFFAMNGTIWDRVRTYYLWLIQTYSNPAFDPLLSADWIRNLRKAIIYYLSTQQPLPHPFVFPLTHDTANMQLNGLSRGWVIIEYSPFHHGSSSSNMITCASTRIVWYDEEHLLHLPAGNYRITPLNIVDEARLGILGNCRQAQEHCFLN